MMDILQAVLHNLQMPLFGGGVLLLIIYRLFEQHWMARFVIAITLLVFSVSWISASGLLQFSARQQGGTVRLEALVDSGSFFPAAVWVVISVMLTIHSITYDRAT